MTKTRALLLSAVWAVVVGPAHAAPAAPLLSGSGWVAKGLPIGDDSSSYAARFKGTAWYVDAEAGNDAATGSMTRPWKTLARAGSVSLQSGDALLLKCGSLWRESLTLPPRWSGANGVLIGAYGDCGQGKRPVIRGSQAVTPSSWQRLDAPLSAYATSWDQVAHQVHVNGQRMLKARFPHYQGPGKEFALADGLGDKTHLRLRANELKFLQDKDLVGATIHIRVVPWQVEQAKVVRLDERSGVLTLDRALSFPILNNTGFILEGKRWMFGAPGEWFYDEQTNKLLLAPLGNTSPANSLVEVTTRDKGFVATRKSGLVIERVAFEHFALMGMDITASNDVSIKDVRVVDADEYGIYVDGSAGTVIQNALVDGAGWTGISVRNSDNSLVRDNRVQNTGLKGWAGKSRSAITVDGQSTVVSNNVIERSANLGIFFFNRIDTRIADNTIVAPCQRMTDCGAVHTWTSSDAKQADKGFRSNARIERNMVLSGPGNLDGTPERGKDQTCGIYLDELTAGVSVLNNILIGSELGICLHNARFNLIRGNTVGAVTHASFSAFQSRSDDDYVKGNRVDKNKLVAQGNDVLPLKWVHPHGSSKMFKGPSPNEDSGNQIVALTGDKAFYQAHAMRSSPNIVPRSAFVPYFSPKGSGGAVKQLPTDLCKIQPCAQFVAGAPEDLLSSPSFELSNTPGKNRYVLSFTAQGGKGGGLSKAVVRRAGPPYDIMGVNQSATTLEPGQVLKTELIFQASSSGTARVDFSGQVQGETIISDVSVKPVQDFKSPDLSHLVVQLVNLSPDTQSFACADTKLSACAATDETGQAVNWPVQLAGRSVKMVLARDATWRQK